MTDSDDPRTWPGGGAVCPECGVALTPENLAGNVEDKGLPSAPGESPNDMIIVATCKRCMGLPDDMGSSRPGETP